MYYRDDGVKLLIVPRSLHPAGYFGVGELLYELLDREIANSVVGVDVAVVVGRQQVLVQRTILVTKRCGCGVASSRSTIILLDVENTGPEGHTRAHRLLMAGDEARAWVVAKRKLEIPQALQIDVFFIRCLVVEHVSNGQAVPLFRLRGDQRFHSGCQPVAAHPVSYTHLRAHETPEHLVCRLLLEK